MRRAEPEHSQLRRTIDRFASRGAGALRRQQVREAVSDAGANAGPLLLVGAVCLLGFELMRLGMGLPATHLNPWLAMLACCVLPAGWILLSALLALSELVERARALAAVDHALALADRLRTAEEFLDAEGADGFKLAALEEAAAHLAQVPSRRVSLSTRSWWSRIWFEAWLVATLLVLALALWLGSLEGEPHEILAPGASGAVGTATAVNPDGTDPPGSRPERNRPDPTVTTAAQRQATKAREATIGASEGVPSEELHETEGKTGAGRASEARNPSDAGAARGAPTQQSPSIEPNPRKEMKPRSPSKKQDPGKEARPPEPLDGKSGTTAGLGSSRGSNKNPAISDWSSKDKVETPDDTELANDEDVEDEDEEQEARGGVQPNLRDRKPPVNRDLRIGFGNRPNPDANGRGGPSEMKKSRGVASLVLGVPLPDRIKGQPNKGKTKVTQERVEPRPEDAAAVAAAKRSARRASAGLVRSPELEPWMQQLVRDYFLMEHADR